MLHRVAGIIAANIEPITRAWVDELRHTPKTEVHNTLLSRQIVSGVKGMLAALAESIRAGQAPDAAGAAAAAAVAAGEPPAPGAARVAHAANGRFPTLPEPLERTQ